MKTRLVSCVGLLIGLSMLVLGAQSDDVRIVAPTDADYVVGPTVFEVSVAPRLGRVTRTVIYVDGLEICRLAGPPWTCTWDAGRGVRQRHVRAVVETDGGGTFSASIRTRAASTIARVEVSAVLVGVSVRDRRQRYVRGLDVSEFSVFEEGTEQPITFFASDDWPSDVLLAVDLSHSMEPHLPEVRAAARALGEALRPVDRLTVAGFNDRLFVLATPEVAAPARMRGLERMRAWGSTALYDALASALPILKPGDGRKAIVLLTDGVDSSSLSAPERVIDAILTDNVLVYVVGFGGAGDDRAVRDQLERLATRSGGQAAFVRNAGDVSRVFRDFVRDITSQYTLGYWPTGGAPGEWRSIRVALRSGQYQVRAREGYVVTPPAR